MYSKRRQISEKIVRGSSSRIGYVCKGQRERKKYIFKWKSTNGIRRYQSSYHGQSVAKRLHCSLLMLWSSRCRNWAFEETRLPALKRWIHFLNTSKTVNLRGFGCANPGWGRGTALPRPERIQFLCIFDFKFCKLLSSYQVLKPRDSICSRCCHRFPKSRRRKQFCISSKSLH